jgi:hypothetical protein
MLFLISQMTSTDTALSVAAIEVAFPAVGGMIEFDAEPPQRPRH